MLQELKGVELLSSGDVIVNPHSMLNLRKELEFTKYVSVEEGSSNWPISFLNSLSFGDRRNPSNPFSATGLVSRYLYIVILKDIHPIICLSTRQFNSTMTRPPYLDRSNSTFFRFPTPETAGPSSTSTPIAHTITSNFITREDY